MAADAERGEQLLTVLREWLALKMSHSSLPGLSIGIARGDSVFSIAFGTRDVEQQKPFLETTPIDVASQTKLITVIAVLQMANARRLELHEPIARYVPAIVALVPDVLSTTTTYELLTHQGGLPRDFAPHLQASTLAEAIAEAVAWSGSSPVPAYSNVGFALIGDIVASVSGESFVSFAGRSVITPLGMRHSSWASQHDPTRSRAYGPLLQGRREPAKSAPPPFLGGLGLWSTPLDMCRVGQAFLGMTPSVLPTENRVAALAVQWGPTVETGGREYALGLEARWMAGRRWLGHTGGADGFMSATYLCPATIQCFSVAMNGRDERILEEVTESIATAIEAFEDPPLAEGTEEYAPFSGLYAGDLGYAQIFRTPSSYFVVDPLQWSLFRSAHRVRYGDASNLRIVGHDFNFANMRLHFVRGPDGAIESMTFGNHPMRRVDPYQS